MSDSFDTATEDLKYHRELWAKIDALRKQLDIAVEALKVLLYATEMRRNWDILSNDDFDEAYPDEYGWAFGDVDENMVQKIEIATDALAEIEKVGKDEN
jgi:hypothetical protein